MPSLNFNLPSLGILLMPRFKRDYAIIIFNNQSISCNPNTHPSSQRITLFDARFLSIKPYYKYYSLPMRQNSEEKIVAGQQFFVFDNSSLKIPRKWSVHIPLECRICLEEDLEQQPGTMVSPCLCSGSVKYVHFKCMVQWIERNSATPLSQIPKLGRFDCQMCKYKIEFECQHQVEMGDWQHFKAKAQSYLFTFLLLLIIILICLGMTLTGLYLFSNPEVFDLSSSQLLFQSIAILCAVILMFFLTAVSVYMWISHFMMSTTSKITKIYPQKVQSPRKKELSSRVSCLQTQTEQSPSKTKSRNATRRQGSNMTIYPMSMASQPGQSN